MQFTNAQLFVIKFALGLIADDKDMPILGCEARELLNKIRLHQQVEITNNEIAATLLREHAE